MFLLSPLPQHLKRSLGDGIRAPVRWSASNRDVNRDCRQLVQWVGGIVQRTHTITLLGVPRHHGTWCRPTPSSRGRAASHVITPPVHEWQRPHSKLERSAMEAQKGLLCQMVGILSHPTPRGGGVSPGPLPGSKAILPRLDAK